MDTTGLKTAVAELQAQAGEPDLPAEQLALLPLVEAERVADVGVEAVVERRGPGRRPGVKNRSTVAMREYLERRYPSPLVGLAETYTRPVAVLAAELQVSLVDAFRLQQAAMEASLPYWHSKAPTELAVKGEGLTPLLISIGGDVALAGGTSFESLLNQGLSGSAAGQSERSVSERSTEIEAGAGDGAS